jgi:RHS repeat-associated protein
MGADMIAELSGSGALLRRYVLGPGVVELLRSSDGNGGAPTNPSWPVADQQGSVVAATDSTGAATATNSYDEYGIPGASNAGRFQYTGQAWIPEIGLYHYKARVYSPVLGRFLQSDPIGYGDGLNMYAYTHGDPVNGSDPSGLSCESPSGPESGGLVSEVVVCPVKKLLLDLENFFGRGDFGKIGPGDIKISKTEDRQTMNCPTVNPGTVGTKSQVAAALADPLDALKAYSLAQEALNMAQRNYPGPGLHNGTGDAYRHFYWSYSMTQKIGSSAAKAFANAHEVRAPGPANETYMDTYNNAMGRAYGNSPGYASTSADKAAKIAIQRNCLVTLK